MNKICIFLAEDHSLVREGLKLLIDNQPDMEVVGEAGDGVSAIKGVIELKPQVMVMDIGLPELSGTLVAREIKAKLPTTQILALTVHEDRTYLRELLHAGASGYILKRAAAETLINAIHVVAGGGVYLDPSLINPSSNEIGTRWPIESISNDNVLSFRESEVGRLIARGYTNREIAAQLKVSVKTVETYKYRVMEKLHLKSRADIVRYALQCGWLDKL